MTLLTNNTIRLIKINEYYKFNIFHSHVKEVNGNIVARITNIKDQDKISIGGNDLIKLDIVRLEIETVLTDNQDYWPIGDDICSPILNIEELEKSSKSGEANISSGYFKYYFEQL